MKVDFWINNSYYLLLINTLFGLIYNISPMIFYNQISNKKNFSKYYVIKYMITNIINNIFLFSYYEKFGFYLQRIYSFINFFISYFFFLYIYLDKIKSKYKNCYFIIFGFFIIPPIFMVFLSIIQSLDFPIIELLAMIINLLTYISEGENISKAEKEKDELYLPSIIINIGAIHSLLWTLYGFITKDKIYIFFYLVGFMISIYYIYKKASIAHSKTNQSNHKEDAFISQEN